jgi:hypothetical protein
MRKTLRAAVFGVPALAGALALASSGTAFADGPPAYAQSTAGVSAPCGANGCGSVSSEVVSLPAAGAPNAQTTYAVWMSDAQQSVVLSLGPLANGDYAATVVNDINDYPQLTVGYDNGSNPVSQVYAAGDNVMLELSYDAQGNIVYTVLDLTNDTDAPFTGTFLDSGQQFTTASAGAIFAQDPYGYPASFTQPTADTDLVNFKHTVVTDQLGTVIDPGTWSKVQARAGGIKQGKLLATSSVGKAFKITLEG